MPEQASVHTLVLTPRRPAWLEAHAQIVWVRVLQYSTDALVHCFFAGQPSY